LNLLRAIWEETGELYRDKTHRLASLALAVSGLLLAWNNHVINKALSCVTDCPQDYSLVDVWLIIVPITMMALAVYYLDMKPTLARKRMMRGLKTGLSGERMTNEPD
jgi:hypothetical protein